jgi:diguanylate cyclase
MSSQATARRSRNSPTKTTAYAVRSTSVLEAYRSRVSALAERIRGTNDVDAIVQMLNQALTETRRLRLREDELQAAQRKVAEAERSIESMKSELEQVKALLQRDPLTGTLNRRGMEDAFRRESSRCDRQSTRMCVAIIDLDDFKQVNDSRGHPTGDRALAHVARLMRATLRPTDRIARFGGEEFLVLLPDTGLDETAAVMERVKRELRNCPLQEGAEQVAITFSCGVAQRTAREPLEPLMARADSALYKAKRAGKNRIMRAH